MDRRQGVGFALAVALAACGGPPRGAPARVIARGTLAYAVEFCGDHLVSIELTERFELVVRDADGRREAARHDLGAAERDWPALACSAGRAWAGGDAGEIASFELPAGARHGVWHQGEAVTALAHVGGLVAIGDAAGVLCVRRADDGALLQCVAAHVGAIGGIDADGGGLVTRDVSGGVRRWELPSLADRAAGAGPILRWEGDPIRTAGRRVERQREGRWELVAEMSGIVRDVAVAGQRLAIAAWIGRLDHPSVVVLGGGTMGE